MKIYITVDDIITSSGRYPERAKSPELTDELKSNAAKLCDAVNGLLTELKWNKPVSISSGFRPSAVNAKVKGAAKKSAHQTCEACDIFQDKKDNQELGFAIRKLQNNRGKKGILGKYGLMMEALENTRGKFSDWVHTDVKIRSERPSMEFKP
jgi:Peptidase M15